VRLTKAARVIGVPLGCLLFNSTLNEREAVGIFTEIC
jgi:hypothetical protein